MSTIYNILKLLKLFYAESVQKVRFVRNAKRYKKFTNFLRRNTSHPLWWNVSNSVVLQKTQPQVDATKLCAFLSTQQPLYNRRITFSASSYYNSRFGEIKFYQNTTIQRLVPGNSGTKTFSQRNYPASFSSTAYPQSTKTDTLSPRPPSPKDIFLSTNANQCNLRSRFNHSNRIWQTGGSSQRLQSPQARTIILSSSDLLRGSHPRLSTREVPARGRVYRFRKEKIHRRCLSQITSPYLQDKGSWRLQMVRPQNSSSSRRKQHRLCYCGQGKSAYQTPSWGTSLSQVQKGLGGSRIQISASPIYASSLYRGTQIPLRRKQCSAYTLYAQKLRISRDSYKSQASSRKRLEILLRPSQNRAKYQRAKVGLLSFQDTHKELFGKQDIFPFAFICLQYYKLVQKIMSAKAIPIRYITNYSQRISSIASKISKIWQQKLTPIAGTLCLQLGVRLCN